MTKTKKSIFLILVVCLMLSTVGLVVSLPQKTNVVNAQINYDNGSINEEYGYGDILSLPEAKLEYNGASYQATEKVLYYPDGVATTKDEVELSVTGIYNIVYSTIVGNLKIKAEQSFKVKQGLFEVTSSASTVSYEEDLSLPKFVKTDEQTAGLKVQLAEGDKFVYNQAINLNECNDDGFITFFTEGCNANMGTQGVSDAKNLFVRITDAYDPNIYVDFQIVHENSQGERVMYFRAAPNGKPTAGCELNSYESSYGNLNQLTNSANRKEFLIDGQRYVARYETHGVTGHAEKIPNVDKYYTSWGKGFTIFYDNNTNILRFKDNANRFISKLDHKEIYDNNNFNGFTTGEVFLSIYAESYSNTYFNLQITQIGGVSGENLQQSKVEDNTKPVINVNANKTEYVGLLNTPFKIFDATQLDINRAGDVNVSVFYAYGTDDQINISTNNNGTFTPVLCGRYTIKYDSKDGWGNQAESKLINVNVIDVTKDALFNLQVEKINSIIFNVDNVLPECSLTTLNGSGYVSVKLVSKVDGSEINADGVFMPMVFGEYDVVYTYGDEIYEYEYSYTVQCVGDEGVLFLEKPVLPIYFIKGMKYSIEKFYAYTFANDTKTAHITEFWVSVDNGDYELADIEEFLIEGNNEVKVKFSYDGVYYNDGQEITVPIIDVSYSQETLEVDLRKYFYSDGDIDVARKVVTGDETSALVFNADENLTSAKMTYIKELPLQKFAMNFYIDNELANFETLIITLTDFYDRTNYFDIKIKMFKTTDKRDMYELRINDKISWRKGSLFDKEMTVRYNATLNQIVFLNTIGFDIPIKFISDAVLCSITFENIVGATGMEITKFCGAVLSNSDSLSPTNAVTQSSGVFAKDSKVTISELTAIDLITPVMRQDISVRVVSPSNKPVVSTDGVTINGNCAADRDYEIILSEYGTYRVYYSYYDQNYNEGTLSYPIRVLDTVKPTITMNGVEEDEVKTAKYLSFVRICDYSVSDDRSSVENITSFVTVFSPRGVIVNLTNNMFKASDKGIWTIVITCYDEAENISTISYKVKVN